MSNPQNSTEDHTASDGDAAATVARLRAGEEVTRASFRNLSLEGEFPKGLALLNCEIDKLTVSGARVLEQARLRGCKIHRLTLNGTNFGGGLDLRNARLDYTGIRDCEFGGALRLDGAQNSHPLHITACKFDAEIRLWDAKLHSWLEVKDCSLHARADLRSFNADEGVIFSGCHFHDDVVLRGAAVTKKLDFGDSRFDKLIDFSKAKLHDFVYLEGIEQGPGQTFAFLNAIGDRVLVRADQVDGRLAAEEGKSFEDAMHEFAFLKRNYSSLHRYEDEDWAFYRFKVSQRRSAGGSWWKPWTKLNSALSWLFLDRGCGYGARPFRAVLTAVILITLFGVLYTAGVSQFNDPPDAGFGSRLLFGMATSVSVFTAGFTGDHLNSADGWILLPLAVEALLGTLLWGLFIVAFSRKIIR